MNMRVSFLLPELLEKEKEKKELALRYCKHSKKKEKLIKRIKMIDLQLDLWKKREMKQSVMKKIPVQLFIA